MPRHRRRIHAVSTATGEALPDALSRVLDSLLTDGETIMPGQLERILEIEDPFELLRVTTDRLAEAQQEVAELARLRRRLIQDLHAQGMSYAQIAEHAGLSRGRIHQIRHTGPAPEGAFFGAETVTIVTPLRHDPAKDRAVVSLEDLTTGKRLEDLARSFALTVDYAHVSVDGDIDLNRPGLVVVCGPRMSEAMRLSYDKDPVFRWERDDGEPWRLRDTATGKLYYAPADEDPATPGDVAYLGRLPRPDGNGAFLAIAGIHPHGSLGVAHLLTTDIGSLWGQVGTKEFSVLVGTEYDPQTNEPVKTELLTPVYRHDKD